MKVQEFFEWVELNKHLLSDCMDADIMVHLLAEGHLLTDTLDIERLVYKFNPFLVKKKGTLCIEVKLKGK